MNRTKEKAEGLYPPKLEWDWRDQDYGPNSDKRYVYENGYEQALKDFQEKIINGLQDIPMEVQKVINEKFWDML